jgi:hypothetical protein
MPTQQSGVRRDPSPFAVAPIINGTLFDRKSIVTIQKIFGREYAVVI